MGPQVYAGNNSGIAQSTKFNDPNSTPLLAANMPNGVLGTGYMVAGAPTPVASSGLPSPLTWLVGAIVLIFLLKFLSEHPKTALNPSHLHIGGYNVLSIFIIVLISVVGMKIIVNRPTFDRGPLAGYAALVNSI